MGNLSQNRKQTEEILDAIRLWINDFLIHNNNSVCPSLVSFILDNIVKDEQLLKRIDAILESRRPNPIVVEKSSDSAILNKLDELANSIDDIHDIVNMKIPDPPHPDLNHLLKRISMSFERHTDLLNFEMVTRNKAKINLASFHKEVAEIITEKLHRD